MGFRFRKSVKICKGLKVNFSKSGASLSIGGRGHSLTLGKRSRATFGIPGTGLSYSTSLSHHKSRSSHKSSSSRSRSSSRSSGRSSVTLPSQVRIIMSDAGSIELRDNRDVLITDPSVIRKIKATDSYKNMVQNLEMQRQQKLNEIFIEAKIENDKFIEIHKQAPQVDTLERYIQVLNSLRPPVYVREKFEVPYPTETSVRELLKGEAKENVTGSLFKVNKLRQDYIEVNLQARINEEIAKWTMAKEQHDATEERKAIAATTRYDAEFNANKQYMNDLIQGNDEVVSDAVEGWIESCELPVEINVDYEWRRDQGTMYLDVDLPEIEDIPENEIVQLPSGNLKEKKKTQSTLKQEYVNLVFGLAIFISANIFNASPAIRNIIISGYTQRRNKAGEINDEYVYSIKFTRDIFEQSMLQGVNPLKFCMRFENRCNMTNTMLLKKISPFDTD